jgi:ribulose 1,5-bisphosphate synthetase/thiazole synthase
MRLEPWWTTRSPVDIGAPLRRTTTGDVAVVGGGVAGLHAALRLAEGGARVVLLEKTFAAEGCRAAAPVS